MYYVSKAVNTDCEIVKALWNDTGQSWTPDTSVKITIYEPNSDVKIVDGVAMNVKDGIAGIYYYDFLTLNGYAHGLYNIRYEIVDAATDYSDDEDFNLVNDKIVGIAKDVNSIVQITGSLHDTTGEDLTPDGGMVVYIYNSDTGAKIVDGEAMVLKDGDVGYFTYLWTITGVTEGTYNIIMIATHGGNDYPKSMTKNIVDTNDPVPGAQEYYEVKDDMESEMAHLCDIKRRSSTVKTLTGESEQSWALSSSNVKCLIQPDSGDGQELVEQGLEIKSTHLGFFLFDADIKEGDKILFNSDYFYVNKIEKNWSMYSHHLEVKMTLEETTESIND